MVCEWLRHNNLPLAPTKSVVLASSRALQDELLSELAGWGLVRATSVKQLGCQAHVGRKRPFSVQFSRFLAARKRLRKFQ
eukprot:1979829-Amphidinium_carterae.1